LFPQEPLRRALEARLRRPFGGAGRIQALRRYRHRSGLGAAVFYDARNVFAAVRDTSIRLRHDVGVGLSHASPVGFLRLDLASPLTGGQTTRRTDLLEPRADLLNREIPAGTFRAPSELLRPCSVFPHPAVIS
jgi:hypothetical protein